MTRKPRLITTGTLFFAALSVGCGSGNTLEEDLAEIENQLENATQDNPVLDPVPGSEDSNDTNPSTTAGPRVTKVGSLELDVDSFGFYINGTFTEFTAPIAVADIRNELVPTQDTCFFGSASEFGFDQPDYLNNVGSSFIPAGDQLTVSSPAGSFAELPKRTQNGTRDTYDLGDDENLDEIIIEGAPPAGLTIDIPGDEFPAATGLAFPEVAPVVATSDTFFSTLTAASEITWETTGNETSSINIFATALVNDPGVGTQFLDCQVPDDGSFTFPAEYISRLGGNAIFVTAVLERSVYNFQLIDGAFIVVSSNFESD